MPGEWMQRKGQKRDRPFAGRDGDPSSVILCYESRVESRVLC